MIIKSDFEINDISDIADYNLILLGGPTTNYYSAKYQSIFPVKYSNNTFSIGPETYFGSKIGIIFLSRHIYKEKLLLVVDGTDLTGFDNAKALIPLHAGVTVPDYVVVENSWNWSGLGGVLAAGYWGNDWKFNSMSSYLSQPYLLYPPQPSEDHRKSINQLK